MRPSTLGVLAALAFCSTPSAKAAGPAPTVAVSGGRIAGRRLRDGGAVFRGIPFAQAPTGDLRWRAPLPVNPWSDVRAAVRPGPPCAQVSMGWNAAFAAAGSEDCLYLDVWTPEWPPGGGRPVMVWLHGGANLGGAGGADPLYEGTSLVRHGVVLVVTQYRLGVLGFLAHPELSRESAQRTSGNYGILDQIAALRWVRDNAVAFGGDPHNVTVFGQSAGAVDASLLTTSPLADGLLRRVIGESGPLLSLEPTWTLARAEEAGRRLAGELKAPAEAPLAFLRSLPVATLLASRAPARPNVDGFVLPAAPAEVFAAGREQRLAMIVGSNAVEFPMEGPPEEIRKRLLATYGSRAPRALALYGLAGPGAGHRLADRVYGGPGEQAGSDLLRCAVVVQGGWHSDAGNATWEYQFDRAIPPKPRTAHSSELPYVFGNLYPHGSQAGDYGPADRRLSEMLQAYWANFARTGDPNGAGLPVWPRFDRKDGRYLEFTADAGTTLGRAQREPFCELFRESLTAR